MNNPDHQFFTRREFLTKVAPKAGLGFAGLALVLNGVACARPPAYAAPLSSPIPPYATGVPNPTAVPTTIATAQPQITEAQLIASKLTPLPNYTWAATKGDAGEQIILLDQKNNPVATYDKGTGGVRWDSLKYFDKLNPFLTNPEGQKTLGTFLEKNKNDVHFITYPAAPDNGKTPSPYVVTLDTKGGVTLIAGVEGTGDYQWDKETNMVAAVYRSKEKTDYPRNNPDGMILAWNTGTKLEKTFIDTEGKTHFAPGAYILPFLVNDVPHENPEIQKVLIETKKNPLYSIADIAYYLVVPSPTDVSDFAWNQYVINMGEKGLYNFNSQQREIIMTALRGTKDPFVRAADITALKTIVSSGENGAMYDGFYIPDSSFTSQEFINGTLHHEPIHNLQFLILKMKAQRNRYLEVQPIVVELEKALQDNKDHKYDKRVNQLTKSLIELSHY